MSNENQEGIPPDVVARGLRRHAEIAAQLSENATRLDRTGAANVAKVVAENDAGLAKHFDTVTEPVGPFAVSYPQDELYRTGINIRRSRILLGVVTAVQEITAPINMAVQGPQSLVDASTYEPNPSVMEDVRWKRQVVPDVYALLGLDWGVVQAIGNWSSHIRTRSDMGLTVIKNRTGVHALKV